MRTVDSKPHRSWRQLIAIWMDRARGRRRLSRVDDAVLKDLGISRVDAWQELKKPFWRG
jgi:uncharacterized protein YjiS (DUF1127 family)